MAFVLADRVKETTTVTGTTSPMTLLGAATGYQTFAAIGNANVTYYTIAGQTGGEWEVGIGTYTSSGTTLSRDTVLASSNAGALVNFSAGTKDVWCDYPAKRAVVGGDGYIENDATISVSSTINTGNNAISGGPLTINSGITVTVPSGSVWTVV
jgi:acetyltransferase-like isoleucine patch superfamily enzyme